MVNSFVIPGCSSWDPFFTMADRHRSQVERCWPWSLLPCCRKPSKVLDTFRETRGFPPLNYADFRFVIGVTAVIIHFNDVHRMFIVFVVHWTRDTVSVFFSLGGTRLHHPIKNDWKTECFSVSNGFKNVDADIFCGVQFYWVKLAI